MPQQPLSRIALLSTLLSIASCATEPDTLYVDDDNSNAETADYFCPEQHVTRLEMARYLEKMKRGVGFQPPAPINRFHDIGKNSGDASWVEQLYTDGVTKGISANLYSPDVAVPREQMAAFIIRLTHGPNFQRGGPSRFTDVTNPDFIGYIEQLADDGITKGCTATEFCPNERVPRAQMAAFLMRALHPGQPDPASTGRFRDVAADHALGGRAEQAVAEGIMEPCVKSLAPPSFRAGNPGFGGVDFSRGDNQSTGWLPDTDNYGLFVAARDKRWWNSNHREVCGGADYGITMVMDIGEVSGNGIYVRSVTFYVRSPRWVSQWTSVAINDEWHYKTGDGQDDWGLPYRTFSVERWLGNQVVLRHIVMPIDQLEFFGDLTEDSDPNFCGMQFQYGLVRG